MQQAQQAIYLPLEEKEGRVQKTAQGRNASMQNLGKGALLPRKKAGKGAHDRAARSHASKPNKQMPCKEQHRQIQARPRKLTPGKTKGKPNKQISGKGKAQLMCRDQSESQKNPPTVV